MKKNDYINMVKSEYRSFNARLLNLEQLAKRKDYTDIINYAYSNAVDAIKRHYHDADKKRLSAPKNYQEAQSLHAIITKFNNSKTSSKAKYDNYLNGSVNRINKQFHTNISSADWVKYADNFMNKYEELYRAVLKMVKISSSYQVNRVVTSRKDRARILKATNAKNYNKSKYTDSEIKLIEALKINSMEVEALYRMNDIDDIRKQSR